MAALKEVEIKWKAEKIGKNEFKNKMIKYLTQHGFQYENKEAKGFDYYYESAQGRVARHRQSPDLNELTIKARVSKTSTVVRHEANVRLSDEVPLKEVETALKLMGFQPVFPIYKKCDIFFIQDGEAEVSVVWYVVTYPKDKKVRPKVFFEIEVHDIGEKTSLSLLKKWKAVVAETLLGLSDKDIEPNSLYEIYSGKKYRVEKTNKKGVRNG